MPYDGSNFETPSLANLSAILRDRSRWPDGFQWNYRKPSGCVLGLDKALWGPKYLALKQMRAWPGMKLTLFLGWKHHCPMEYVRPQQVADAIDEYLAAAP
jgi:hypothetical protein